MKSGNASKRRNLLIGTAEGVLAMPWVYLSLPGNFVMAALLTQYYGIGKAAYGLLASLPMWSNAAQIFLLPWLARFLTPKDLALGMGWLNIGMWTMLAAVLPYLPTDDPSGVARLFVVFLIVASLSQAFLGVGWTSWVRVWVPSRLRGKYFGARNRWLNVGTMAFLLLALALFEAEEAALWPYQVLLIVAVLCRYGSLIWQHGIRTTAEHLDVVGQGWFGQLRQNVASPGLLRFIMFAAWTSFWMAFVGPFIPIFSFEELGVAPGTFTILVILATASGIFGWWFWGKKVDQHGCLSIIAIGLAAWALQDGLWAILNRGNVWLLYPMWLCGGFVSVAYFLGSFNLLLKLVPSSAKVTGVSLHLALTSLAAAVAPVLAGLLLAHFLASGWGITAYRVGFVTKSMALLAGLLLLHGIREPQRKTQPSLTGAFRTIRQLVAAQGASFLGRGG